MPSAIALALLQRGELEERLLDQLVDDRALHRAARAACSRIVALHERRDVEAADRLAVASRGSR